MTRLTETEEEMFTTIYYSIMNMNDGEIKELNPTHSNYAKYINCVKLFMDMAYDTLNDFSLTFNNNFTKLRKDANKTI